MKACQANRIILDKIKSAESLLPFESCSSALYSTFLQENQSCDSVIWISCNYDLQVTWRYSISDLKQEVKAKYQVALMVKSCNTTSSETFGSCDMWQNLMVQRPESLFSTTGLLAYNNRRGTGVIDDIYILKNSCIPFSRAGSRPVLPAAAAVTVYCFTLMRLTHCW